MVVVVKSSLIRRAKQHFITLPPPASVDMVLGNNGYIWLSRSFPNGGFDNDDVGGGSSSTSGGSVDAILAMKRQHAETSTSGEERQRLARVRNAIVGLDRAGVSISAETVMKVVRASVGMSAKHMTSSQGGLSQLLITQIMAQEQGGEM